MTINNFRNFDDNSLGKLSSVIFVTMMTIVWSSLTTRQGATFDRWTLDQHPLDRGTGGASVSWYVFGNVKLVLTDPILLLPPATRGEVATATRGCWGKQTSCLTGGTVNYTSFGPKLVSVMMVDIIGCCRTK